MRTAEPKARTQAKVTAPRRSTRRIVAASPPPAPRAVAPAPAPEQKALSLRNLEPTGREVTLGVEEIIVSKTDLSGKIVYANDIFLSLSGFVESEVLGQPHSFIRHPEMPRCVFKLLWDSIQSGREIFAYVVNMAKNGDHYWVFAHVTPSVDERGSVTGYHSNRRSPDRAALEKVRALYSRLVSIERGHARKADAIAASLQELDRIVGEKHKSYEEFVFSL